MAKKKKKFQAKKNVVSRKKHVAGQVKSKHIAAQKIDWYQLLFLTLLIAIGFLIYSNTLQSPFTFDDEQAIVENPSIRMTKLSINELIDGAIGWSKNRPIAMVTFALNYYLGEYNPLGYHLVNIWIHIANGLLLYFFLKTTLLLAINRENLDTSLDNRTAVTISFFASLLWVVHPVQTNSVTYIVQRMSSLGAMFYLLALLLYVKGRLAQQKALARRNHPTATNTNKKSNNYYFLFAGCVMATLLSFGCKESTVLLPLFILLYEWYFFQDLSTAWLKTKFKYIAVVLILLSIAAIIYLGSDPIEKIKSLKDFAEGHFTIGQRLWTQTRVVIYYLGLIVYPNPSRLNLDYDFPLSYSLIDPLTTLLCLIIIIGLVFVGIFLAKKQRLISFCIFWFFGNLLIESSIIPLAIIFEHRLYLPSMMVCLIAVILFFRYIKPAWLPVGIIIALVAIGSYWTFERNKVWQDSVTIWTDCTKKSPNKARPYSNLGVALVERKMNEEALPNYLKALQINPNYAQAHFGLAALLEDKGETNEAIKHYRIALQIKPNYEKCHNNLGLVLLEQDQKEEAKKHFKKAIEINPTFAKAYNNLGFAFYKEGRINEAVELYNTALEIDPKSANALLNLGNTMLMQGKTEQAIDFFYKAVKIKPDFAEAHNNLGGQLLSQGKINVARRHLVEALRLDPDLAEAHNNFGIILIQEGNLEAAIIHFQDAVRIDPEFKMAADNLKRALAIRNSMVTRTE